MAEQLDMTTEISGELLSHTPGHLRVIRRNGSVVDYDDTKIAIALTKAFIAVEGSQAAASDRVRELVHSMVINITEDFKRRAASSGYIIHIEAIQDKAELALMRASEHQVAREYVLYREKQRMKREQELTPHDPNMPHITLSDGAKIPLDLKRLGQVVEEACSSLEEVSPEDIIKETLRNLFDGASMEDVNKALIMSARVLIEKEPNYTFVAARLLLNDLRGEALSFLNLANEATQAELSSLYPEALKRYIERGIALEMLDPVLTTSFDLEELGQALVSSRDLKFTYLGLQTLYDRYFIHYQGVRYELPQVFFMRVAMGLALGESQDRTRHAIAFYNLLSTFDYMSSTPTLFNAATRRPQLSSCFLTSIPDDLEGIYNALRDNALLSKFAGGLGNSWTKVRAMGAHIKGTNGKSLGPVPFMKVADSTAIAVNQGGKRKGAVCAYFEVWHMDIFELLELRKNTGDDRRRTHDMNTAVWVPDLLMKRKAENQNWTLFSPNEVPGLDEKFGADFEKAYIMYEEKAQRGEISSRTIPAVSLWRKMLSMLFETGHPWITFKDTCNLRSPQQHAGVIHSSNLCTEITLNTSQDEIAVCNLGSINLINHMTENGLDHTKLQATIKTAIRMLDNVIDINFYPVPQARKSNFRHRPIGLGIMGFQDALYKLRIPYSSEEAVAFADQSMEVISYYAILASSELAEERGCYQSYEGSLWSKGILPIDSIGLLHQSRGEYLLQDRSMKLDWDSLRKRVATVGMRNSNVMAIAPTATISNICGVSQSIEPTYQNLYVKSNLSGEFTVVNPYLVVDLKKASLWDEVMINDLKYYDGSLQKINRIPSELKKLYANAFEVDPKWLVEAGSRRQKWIDQSQSLNLYMAEPSGKKLDVLYTSAWLLGLKTTYYLRSLGATNAEKSTIADGALNAVDISTPKSCSIDDPDCEACQ
ncbi:MAG: ribonucleoside-diphosphate reductase subunit alpha [Gammaproteobacteria bacterium]|nr:ribonucleoside-diphosphate reductase subunit alpha [Gammaproteobacteria bacterium]